MFAIPEWLYAIIAFFHFQKLDYETALREANKIHTPGFFWAPLHRFVSLAQLGHVEEAQRAHWEILTYRPDFECCGRTLIARFITEKILLERFLDSFEKAGVPIART